MSIEIDEISKKYTRQEFIDKVVLIGCAEYNIATENYCNGNAVKLSVCRECITKSIKNIKFKDELEDVKMGEEKVNERGYHVDELLNKIEEYRKKIVDLNRDNENIADRVHNEALKDLQEITQKYECQINELKTKIQYLESLQSPVCDCMIDPEAERKHYKSIADENIRLKNVIKLMAESL